MKTVSRLPAIAAGVALLSGLTGAAIAQAPVGGQPIKPFFAWSLAEQKARFPAIEKTYQTATIQKGETVRELPMASTQIAPRITHAGRTTGIEDFMSANNISGVIALKDGKVALEKYANGRTSAERWPSTGLAQAMTSTLIGGAIKDGWIKSEYDPVQRYLLDLQGTAYEDVSLRRLMAMASGVKWNESYLSAKSDAHRLAAATYKRGAAHPTVALAATLLRETAPGKKHTYKTIDADLAGLALTSALAGKTLSQYASEKIWAPYGMEADAVWALDPAGKEKASGPLSMTLRDAARFGQFLLDGGQIADKPILPANWISEATSNQLDASASGKAGYFWTPFDDGAFEASGLYGQGFYVNPEENVVIVINAASVVPNDAVQVASRNAVINAIRKELADRPDA